MNLQDKYRTLLNSYEINTPLRIAHFFAQIEHESNLKPIFENLNYDGDGLLKIFKRHFGKMPLIELSKYVRKPQKIANRVYANRMGNGNEASGDGWRYRGRGFLQITGRANYTELAENTILDCVKNPDLLLQEANAMISALWFWHKNKLNAIADKNDIVELTRRINGGVNGLAHRKELLEKYLK